VQAAIETRAGEGSLTGDPSGKAAADGKVSGYNDLTAAELLEVIPSLEAAAVRQLRTHEAAGRARKTVLAALDRQLARLPEA
jgi:hypothetical protein